MNKKKGKTETFVWFEKFTLSPAPFYPVKSGRDCNIVFIFSVARRYFLTVDLHKGG